MSDASDEEALKRHIFWDHVDQTVRLSVLEFAHYSRYVLLGQFKGSVEERANLEAAIEALEPAIDAIIARLSLLKTTRPIIYKSVFQEMEVLLSSYKLLGMSFAYTQAVESAALQPVVEQRSLAGKKSAELRAASMTEPWHKSFNPILSRIRDEKPNLLNAALIREARRAYGEQAPKLPGDRQITTHVRTLIESGDLSAGPKDGRGRPVKKSTR